MAFAEKKNDWFWSEGALDKWERLDKDIRKLIIKKADAILAKHPKKDTISEDDMNKIIEDVLYDLSKHA